MIVACLFHGGYWTFVGMEHEEAMDLIGGGVPRVGPAQRWADLGCGTGTFTRALADLLPTGSLLHAVDRDLRGFHTPAAADSRIVVQQQRADITASTFTLSDLDGILLANVLHFIADQATFCQRLQHWLKPGGTLVIVEYDTASPAPPWVPFPVPFDRLSALFPARRITRVGQRASVYQRAPLYAARCS